MSKFIGSSQEVIRHHHEQHAKTCDVADAGGGREVVCPCGQTILLICACDEVLYAATLADEPCQHLKEMINR